MSCNWLISEEMADHRTPLQPQLQRHLCRDEFFLALDDNVGMQISAHDLEGLDDEFDPRIDSIVLEKGDYVLVPRGVWHRPKASTDRARVLEVAFGLYDEGYDISRLLRPVRPGGKRRVDGGVRPPL